jgi:hypothetical protein
MRASIVLAIVAVTTVAACGSAPANPETPKEHVQAVGEDIKEGTEKAVDKTGEGVEKAGEKVQGDDDKP